MSRQISKRLFRMRQAKALNAIESQIESGQNEQGVISHEKMTKKIQDSLNLRKSMGLGKRKKKVVVAAEEKKIKPKKKVTEFEELI